jgi:5-enolpyruvylshikimate-3-phosphate synthase
MVAAAIAGGDVLVKDARPEHMDAVIAKLRAAGVQVSAEAGGIRVRGNGELRPVDVTTQPHPGFPTDMQAQFMVLACLARGQSVIKEMIFENRFMHVPELGRMGADIHVDGRVAVIRGRPSLQGATVMATDLRASASLVIAGLVAEGKTEVLLGTGRSASVPDALAAVNGLGGKLRTGEGPSQEKSRSVPGSPNRGKPNPSEIMARSRGMSLMGFWWLRLCQDGNS